jgi:tRNA modification GTPase
MGAEKKQPKSAGIDDTITAISTATGVGALGIVRISGPQAVQIAQKIFTSTSCPNIRNAQTHTVIHGYINAGKEVVDEVLLTVMKAPCTYTREDMVEISGHGGIFSLRRILDEIIKQGARLAGPGEFTQRAFLNGRIDLSQAESVVDVINAETAAGLSLAINQLKGALSGRIKKIFAEIMDVYAPLEAAIDFPEEEIIGIGKNELRSKIVKAQKDIEDLIRTKDDGRRVRNGINLVIAGRANVGKSSLFNHLLEENRSIVTHIPGTTRDILEDNLVLRGMLFKISDTAGLRKAKGLVEKIGIDQTHKRIEKADLVLYLIDHKKGLSPEDVAFMQKVPQSATIIVINKIDLPGNIKKNKLFDGFEVKKISVKENKGMDDLRAAIVKKAEKIVPRNCCVKYLINERQHEALLRTQGFLQNALGTIGKKLSYEFIALDLKAALNALGEITGENITENTLHKIFSRFCIGK